MASVALVGLWKFEVTLDELDDTGQLLLATGDRAVRAASARRRRPSDAAARFDEFAVVKSDCQAARTSDWPCGRLAA